MSVPAPGPHGGDAARVARALGMDRDDLVDLSTTLNPVAPDVAPVLAAAVGGVGDYPDATGPTRSLARAVGVDADLVVLTNGGAEGIALVATITGTGSIVEPEFSLYRRHLAEVDDASPRWRSDPSNPLGALADADEVAGVWDEAHLPLVSGAWTRPGRDGTWRIGSLTKLWACPGVRLGYVIAPDARAAAALRSVQPRWSVGSLALSLIDPMLALTDLGSWASSIATLRAGFVAALREMGYDARGTDANWVLIEGADDLRTRAAPRGVLVRDASSFGLAGTVRAAVPRPADLDRVLAALAAIAPGGGPP